MAQAYMAIAPAAEAFIERVDPYCMIANTEVQIATASSDIPAPSWPKKSTHFSGSSASSNWVDIGRLSIPIIGTSFASHQDLKSAIDGWCKTCKYLSVTIAPRLFQSRFPTMCTLETLKAFAVRTTDPIFKSCCQFSIAICNWWRWVSRCFPTANQDRSCSW